MKTGRFLKKVAKTALKSSVPAANILIDFSEDDDAEMEEAVLAVLCQLSEQLGELVHEVRRMKELLEEEV